MGDPVRVPAQEDQIAGAGGPQIDAPDVQPPEDVGRGVVNDAAPVVAETQGRVGLLIGPEDQARAVEAIRSLSRGDIRAADLGQGEPECLGGLDRKSVV